MEIPYYILGILYLVILSGFFLMAFFTLYHLIKFGFFDFTGRMNFVFFCCAWIIILTFSFVFLMDVPWFDSFDLFERIASNISFEF